MNAQVPSDEQASDSMFSPGELAVYTRAGWGDCTVTIVRRYIGPRRCRVTGLDEWCDGYLVAGESIQGNEQWPLVAAARISELRKVPPPREDLRLVRWDQCPWQPESINV